MITQHYQLNLIPTGKDPVIVRCSQYDKDSRSIEFSLFNGKEFFALGDGYVVTVRGTKQDGNAFEYDCSIVDTSAVFSINQQMTLFAGKFPCELRIMVGNEILGSANFYLYVEKSPMDEDSAISESDLPAYERLLADVQSKNVSDWLEENISQETGCVIDTSLSVSGAAADAKAVGDEIQRLEAEIEDGGGGTTNYNDLSNKPRINNVPLEGNKTAEELGLVVSSSISDDLKQALLQLAQKVAYIDSGGQNYYKDLYDALYAAVPTSITAVYTQSGTVYTTDTLDSLRSDLIVTAHYSDGTSKAVTDYTLSGNLTVGTSVITVNYQDKTDTFSVTVTRVAGTFSISNNLTGCTNSNSAATVAENASYTCTITADTGYTLTGATVSITMGGTSVTGYYSNGTISIPNVTGDVVITVVATAVAISSISAVFNQGTATIYDTDSLDTLKQYLTVTATYSDSSTATVPSADYTLSGTLAEGTSTITVSYGGKTTTFNVTVEHSNLVLLYNWDFTNSLEDSVGHKYALPTGVTQDSSGISILAANQYVTMSNVFENGNEYTVEMDVVSFSIQDTSNHNRFLMWAAGTIDKGFIFRRTGKWAMYGTLEGKAFPGWEEAPISDPTYFNGATLKMTIDSNNLVSIYKGNTLLVTGITTDGASNLVIGSSQYSAYNLVVSGLRVYRGIEE